MIRFSNKTLSRRLLPRSHWRPLGTMKVLIILLICTMAVSTGNAIAEQSDKNKISRDWSKVDRIYDSKPRRFGGSLRNENLNDIEVREIIRTTRTVTPGAIVNIDGVRSSCPCEDGPKCSAQVWVVAYESDKSNGLILSKIENKWVIGPVQKWWLQYNSLRDELRAAYRRGSEDSKDKIAVLKIKLNGIWENFPVCTVSEQ